MSERAIDRHSVGRWQLAAVGALACVVGAFFLFGPPRPVVAPLEPAGPSPSVHISSDARDSVIKQEADLLDPAPLFLPSLAGQAQKFLPSSDLTEDFPAYPPRLLFGTSLSQTGLMTASPIAVPATPADTLAVDPPALPVRGMGRRSEPVPRLEARAAFVEVFETGSARRVFSESLPPGTPGLAELAARDWEAQDFLATVDAAGLVGPPTPIPSPLRGGADGLFSPLDERDLGALENALVQVLVSQAQLAPGTYRISVGP